MRFHVGTSGYSYKEWLGSFYPEELKAPQMLGYYAEHLKAVEINNTFYRMPTRKLLDSWSAQVPEDFGPRLGPMLFQLPPYLKMDAERLAAFLEILPSDVRAAFEFRDPSWLDDEIFGLLRDSDRALVIADTGGEKDPPFEPTAGWGYLRLRREGYTEEELTEWAQRVAGQDWSDAFVFFKHEDDGAGPRMAAAFGELLATAASRDRSS
jgi:uncharacterized protein YecE (DUF72 family)